MAATLSYTRKFIILKKEFSTISGISPKGHGKLEIKGIRGIVTVNIENAEKDTIYNISFISNDKLGSIWDLGKIFTDDIGRGKGEYVFTQRDLELRNFPIDKISGILIMRDGDILLGGYIDKENGCIERYIESMQRKPAVEPMHDPIYDTPAVEPTYEPLYDLPAVETKIEADLSFEEVVETIIEEPINDEIVPEEIVDEIVEEIIQDEKEEITEESEFDLEDFDEDSMEPDYKTLDYIRKLNQKNQTTNYVLSILRFFPYVDPFKYTLKGYNWWIVELDKENEYRSFLPYFSYISGGNTKEHYAGNIATCNQLMNKYQHYLFGLYNEEEKVKYFVYGIPGSFTQEEHPYKGANGFNTWHPGQNTEGYWIIFIDPMTGKLVDAQIPMVPID